VPRNFDGQENNTHTRPFRPHSREERARFESKGYSSTNDRKRKRSTDSSHERLSTESNDRKKIKRQPCLDFRNKKNRSPLLKEVHRLSFRQSDREIILSKLSDLQKKEQHTASYFSEFLQHLFYYLPHALTAQTLTAPALAKRKAYVRTLLAAILEKFGDSLFIMPNFWVDPKEGYTVLMGSVGACEQDDQKLSIDLLKRIKMDCRLDPKALCELIQIKSTNTGFSVLILACRHGLTNLVSALLQTAKDKLPRNEFWSFLTYKDRFGFSPLSTSCKEGHLEVVKTFLEVAERSLSSEEFQDLLTHQDKCGFSPLLTSCKAGHLKVVQILLEVAKDKLPDNEFRSFLTHKDTFRFSSLNTSCKAGHLKVVQILLEVAKDKLPDNEFRSFLTHKDTFRFSSLNTSCKAGHLKVVQILLEVAKDKLPDNEFRSFLTNKDTFRFSPLNTSCKEGHLEVVKTLLDVAERRSLSPEELQDFLTQQNNDGFSPLLTSCKVGHLKVVQTLLEVAKRKLSPEAFRYLLTQQNNDGFSAFNASCKAGHPEIVKCLVHAWRELDEDCNEEAFRKFLEQKNRHGFTPLNAAAKAASELACSVDNNRKQDYTDVLAYLLILGANPDIPNKRGYTARQNCPSYASWPPRLLENAEDSKKNELKPYLSNVSRHEKSWFFRPAPSAKPFHSIGHHHTIRHHHRSRHTTMRTHRW